MKVSVCFGLSARGKTAHERASELVQEVLLRIGDSPDRVEIGIPADKAGARILDWLRLDPHTAIIRRVIETAPDEFAHRIVLVPHSSALAAI